MTLCKPENNNSFSREHPWWVPSLSFCLYNQRCITHRLTVHSEPGHLGWRWRVKSGVWPDAFRGSGCPERSGRSHSWGGVHSVSGHSPVGTRGDSHPFSRLREAGTSSDSNKVRCHSEQPTRSSFAFFPSPGSASPGLRSEDGGLQRLGSHRGVGR